MEIALSTTEAEYQALSTCMHDILPLRTLIQELSSHSFIDDMTIAGTHIFSGNLETDIFEDNQSCLLIAHSEAVRPCTKHLSINIIISVIKSSRALSALSKSTQMTIGPTFSLNPSLASSLNTSDT